MFYTFQKKLFDWQYLNKNYYNFYVLESEKKSLRLCRDIFQQADMTKI